jgi:site-specific DNA-methyltransferase (adenine-specific)
MARETGVVHATQKPLALMEFLVKSYTNAGDVVCDPFMGSGSTGVACVHTGRRFIGIEKTARYFDIACRRIEDAVAGKDNVPTVKPPRSASAIARPCLFADMC